ncbi:hypothetical protein HPB50_000465 [Hyalomma asiaticum]|uniref:Uncharacterized protein n=1 Tax=Hyalomma asiaticum TaxID=266040 RepID=A0ACB7T2K8_HYAAI|nr:hypothetical protein HPB50_000465 [Hyalomma asiaticum]
MTGVDIKVEPSSPQYIPPPEHLEEGGEGPPEPPDCSVAGSSETSGGTDVSSGDENIGDATRASPKGVERSEGTWEECCFASKGLSRAHRHLHMGERPHACLTCGRKFRRRQHLIRHERVHTGERPYACLECGQTFTQNVHLVKHRALHTGEKPYACPLCGRSFAFELDLVKHKQRHTGEKRYACPMCPSKFCAKISLDRHKRLHTSGVEMFHCPECGKTFTQATVLESHRKWHTVQKPFPCHLCPARFTHNCFLENHLASHVGAKQYKCPVCEGLYSTFWCLKRHMCRKHDGVKIAVTSAECRVKIMVPRPPTQEEEKTAELQAPACSPTTKGHLRNHIVKLQEEGMP